MKHVCYLLLAFGLVSGSAVAAAETDWPAQTPLIQPQPDGVVVLNAEAAAFVMDDKLGQHVLNWTDPRIEIEDGCLTRVGSGFQFPAWRLQVPGGIRYRVVANLNLEQIEPLSFRVSFYAGKAEGRVAKALVRTPPGTGVQPVELGVTGLSSSEYKALVILTGRHMGRLPEIRDIRLIPVTNTDADVETRAYPKLPYPPVPHSAPPPLYPTGNLGRLRAIVTVVIAPDEVVEVPPPADAVARREAFAARNSEQGVEALARRLHGALVPGTRGLEAFEDAFARGRHMDALEAYRAFFFAKLKDPAAYGAAAADLRMNFFQKDGKSRFLWIPDPKEVERNLAGMIGKWVLGAPGAVNWAPHTLIPPEGIGFERGPDSSPFWKSPEGRKLSASIDYFRGFTRINHDHGGGPFGDLLLSYLMTGDRAHLQLYADYMEDWAMHVDADIDNHPLNMRAAVEIQVIGAYLGRLRVILDERPALAEDFPAPALARILLNLTEMYHPYMVRAKRAELANWGIMGLAAAMKDSLLLHEFHAMQYMNRECSRLARINFIQHVALDGEGLEAWDEGHMAIDGMLGSARFMSLYGAPVMGPLEQQTVLDHLKVTQRSLLTHFTPDGNYWSSWLPYNDFPRSTINGKTLARRLIDDVYDEPVVHRRVDAVLRRDRADRTPPLSDIQPYGALYMLRDGFGGDSVSLLMQNFPVRSQTQGIAINGRRGHVLGSTRTQYGVARGDRGLLESSAIAVDGKPPQRWVGATPSGGKTDYSFKTPRHVQPGRFHASPRFDLAETIQDSPYTGYKFSYYPDVFGLGSAAPDEVIRDVTATRQVIHLRGTGVFLVADRIRNPGPEREFTKFFLLPVYGFGMTNALDRETPVKVKLERLGALAQMDAVLLDVAPEQNRVRSGNPGFGNVSVYAAGHAYQWGGRQRRPGEYEPVAPIRADTLYRQAQAAKDPAFFFNEVMFQRVSARWRGTGNQADLSVIATRPSEPAQQTTFEPDLSRFRDMSTGGMAVCAFRTADGMNVALSVSPDGKGPLKAGPAGADAGTLLLTQKDGVYAGIVLDGDAVTIGGRRYAGPAGGFEFCLAASGAFSAQPIHTPIDTTIIQPQQTVFAEDVAVSFEIPTQDTGDIEFRYTLDGSDPTLASARYETPVRLTQDTLVKVRPFRKGLAGTPWNIAGVDGGKTVWAIYRKQAPLKADAVTKGRKPGLAYRYYEGPWPQLMSLGGMQPSLEPRAQGESAPLLDKDHLAAIRKTDRAYQVKYSGYLSVPETGVYRFFAPEHLYNTTMDAGYDLRVWVDGEEWFPNPDLHAENIWSVALEAGAHRFDVSFTDFRWKRFRNEYIMTWREEQVWQGVPVLELDGPTLERQPVPAEWLMHKD